MTDAFEDWKERALSRDIHEIAEELGTKLSRSSEGWVGPCPACGGTDRFTINNRERFFWCRKSNAGGDVIKLVEYVRGVDFKGACEYLTGEPAPGGRQLSEQEKIDRERRQQELAARRAAERAREETEEARKLRKTRERLQAMFEAAVPIAGTAAERYLAARGLSASGRLGVDLRFTPELEYRGFEHPAEMTPPEVTEVQVPLGRFPAMLAAVRAGGEIIALHRTYLAPDTPTKLKPPGDAKRNAAKKFAGKAGGGVIWLTPPAAHVVMGEGIETSWSAYHLGVGGDDVAVAAGGSLGNMAGKMTGRVPHPLLTAEQPNATIPNGEPDLAERSIEMPEVVREITLVMDGDSDAPTTAAKMLSAVRRFAAKGLSVFVVVAPRGQDLNDVWQASRSGAEAPGLVPMTAAEFEIYASNVMAGWLDGKPVRPRDRIRTVTFGEVTATSAKKHQWIINDIIPRRDIAYLAGPSGSGKSFLGIDMGMSIARGIPYFGNWVRRGGVFYVAGEGGVGAEKRLYGYKLHHNVEEDQPFTMAPVALNIYRKENSDIPVMIDTAREWDRYWLAKFGVGLEAIFIDTLAKSMTGADENSYKDVSQIMSSLEQIREACGCSVVLVHHMNKSGTTERGHSSMFAGIETSLRIAVDDRKVRTVTAAKQKDGEGGDIFKFELLEVQVGTRSEEDGKPITTCVVLPVGQKEQYRGDRAKAFSLNAWGEVVMRALFAALETDGTQAGREEREAGVPAGERCVHYLAWRDAFKRVAPPGENGEAQPNKRIMEIFRRELNALDRYNVVGWARPYLWYKGRPLRQFPSTIPKQEAPRHDEAPMPDNSPSSDGEHDVLPF